MKNFLYIKPTIILCFTIILFYSNNLQAYQWDKTFGGDSLDVGYSVQQTYDEGYILAGSNCSSGLSDFWLIKTDINGNEEWDKTYGGSDLDWAEKVIQTSDSGYLMGGRTKSYGAGGYDIWLIKTDAEGNEEWNKTYGGPYEDVFWSVCQTNDNGYVMVGFNSGNGDWIVKTDSTGNIEWEKIIDEGYYWDVIQNEEGDLIATGGFYCDVLLVKMDIEGNEIWSQTYHYPSSIYSIGGSCVRQKQDGGYIIGGVLSANYDDNEILILSTDAEGNYLWYQIFWDDENVGCNSVGETQDGGFFVISYTYVPYHYTDFWLIKTDSGGNMQWDMTFGGAEEEWAYSGQQTADGGYIVVGLTTSYGAGIADVWLVYYSTNIPGVPISPTEIILILICIQDDTNNPIKSSYACDSFFIIFQSYQSFHK